jgi:hypothetical protein
MFHVPFRHQEAQETDSYMCRVLIKDGLGGFFGALKYHLHLGRAERVWSLDMEERANQGRVWWFPKAGPIGEVFEIVNQ